MFAWHGIAGVVPVGAGRAGVEGSLRLLAGAGMGMLLGSLAATASLCGGWRSGARHGFLPGCSGWGCVVWRGGLRTGEWTRADRVAAPVGVAGRGLLVLMYFDRVPFVGGLVVCLIVL